jgi:hypothetical protein
VRSVVGSFISAVFAAFVDLDATFLEMNPLTLVPVPDPTKVGWHALVLFSAVSRGVGAPHGAITLNVIPPSPVPSSLMLAGAACQTPVGYA